MIRDPALSRLRPVLSGAAAGLYDLPPDVLELSGALDRLSTFQVTPPSPSLAAAIENLNEATVFAARHGGELPDPAAVVDARRAEEAWELQQNAVRSAEERVAQALVSALTGQAEEIIRVYLRPAFESVMERAASQAAAVKGYTGAGDGLLGAPEKVRRAWIDLAALAAQYGALRTARSQLAQESGLLVHDPSGGFGEFRNLTDLWPPHQRSRRDSAPWPTDPRDRLVWLLNTPTAEVWFPTVREQNDAAQAYGKGPRPAPATAGV